MNSSKNKHSFLNKKDIGLLKVLAHIWVNRHVYPGLPWYIGTTRGSARIGPYKPGAGYCNIRRGFGITSK